MNNKNRLVFQTPKHGDLNKNKLQLSELLSASYCKLVLRLLSGPDTDPAMLYREKSSRYRMLEPYTPWCRSIS